MTSDPVFGESAGADVSQTRTLAREVGGVDQCPSNLQTPNDACAFVTCGAAGTCRTVSNGPSQFASAGCACLPGATARLTKAPDGSATVICQDGRLSFLNPGDQVDDDTLPDPCAGFSCGDHGQCVAMNMTPTCVCDQGYVAVGSSAADGSPLLQCLAPSAWVPISFYTQSLPALPDDLPGGRTVTLSDPSFPAPGYNAAAAAASGGCALGGAERSADAPRWTALLSLLAFVSLERRRTRRSSRES
jgi:hypothetical protein